ncbi:putative Ig domain-containing protein [Telmatobacter sp. DSM 110680]|uniref:Ig domain-containing protein n=1 Tax=Telmatobacter sp. DSM 110680 TaxID=3036704 RepID=A0AAU7DMW8_9BACT
MVIPETFPACAGNRINVSRNVPLSLSDSKSLASQLSVVFLLLCLVLSGCGGGGYAGGGISSLSATSFVLDAGQSVKITANLTGTYQLAWSFSGNSCNGSACGSLSSSNGSTITYTAPSGITAPMQVTLLAAIPNTKSQETVSITVNPDPTLTGVPPAGVVGQAYSTTIVSAGGTAPLTTTVLSGTLPAGLTFNAATGVISGIPTTAGTSMFTLQLTDASSVPFTVTANESILISNPVPPLTLLGGPQPQGEVGVAYTTSLTAAGGVTPYSWSIASGSLPAGLNISPTTGVISGTPTSPGTSTFVVQVQDSTTAVATATASITVVSPLTLVGGPQPEGTVGVAYTTSFVASGGVTPYAWSVVAGSLPAGLTISPTTGVISGVPTNKGTSSFTVQVKDTLGATATAAVSITINSPLAITNTLPNGTVGVSYAAAISATGGTTPYTCSITAGTLPAGLALSGCSVAGTPTTAQTSTITVKVTDSSTPSQSVSANETIIISPTPLSLTSTLPNGTVGVAYSSTITASGGTSPYACSITGTLPAGLSLNACVVSGIPTTAGSATVTVKVTDSGTPAQNASQVETIVIAPPVLALTNTLPNGTVGVAYSANITASGGTTPYSCSITGTLPAGLSLAGCTVSGTPTASGSSTILVKVTDAGSPAQNASQNETIVIAPAALTLTNTLPNGTVGVPYSSLIGATGGTSPYTCSITGTLPGGLTLSGCTVSGTPTTQGSSPITVKVTDSGSPAQNASQAETIVIAPAALTITNTLPGGTVGTPYSATITAADGTPPYSCSITGALPAGLTLTGCTVGGTPTAAGSSPITVKVTDSGSPAQNASQNETIVIAPATLAITGTLPNGTVGSAYSTTITATGGTTPYTCSITGTLPAGLTLAGCTVSGTPTTAGSSPVVVKVTDSGSPAQNASSNETIVINPAALTITGSLPNGTVGSTYSATITASGGTSPYTCSISGTLPAGLILSGCTVSGTPTSAGSSTVTVTVTDSGSPTQNASKSETVTINPSPLTLTASTLPDGTVGVPYSAAIGVSGGTSPYSCTITSGTLPAGLTMTGCSVSGTPTTAGSSTVTVKVTDSESPSQSTSGPETIVINPAALTLNSTLPDGTVGVVYSATIGANGGTTPYSCSITTGTLPAGLSLTGCVISGTPTAVGTSNLTVTVTDASNPTKTVSGAESITIHPSGTLSLTGTLPIAIVGVPYSYTLKATGGNPPYTYALTAGSLPPGITLQSDGLISGTPTQPGATSFTATVTDSVSATASLPLILLVQYPSTPYDGELTGPYAYLFQGYDDVLAGVLAYQTATVGSFTADGTGGINLGELDANHQSSDPSGTTVQAQNFLGTYEINADSRGKITITTLNPDGTTDQTFTYAISLKAPVSPATVSTQGSLIEFDNDQLVGTKGSGQLLAQTPSSFSAGLKGSYAFGLSGDTPCLVSCTVGIASGPVATVGAFTANGSGSISAGTADTNIASFNFANAPVSGSYQTADQNGRVQLEMTNTSISDGLYPTNFAVYIVNANEAFILSTDKHSAYTLLAGTAELQTSGSFSNASMNGPFVGYEDAQSNPGLLGTTLQNVLNFSTATVFRASGNGAGTCDTTNFESGGLTSLVDNLTGLSNSNKSNLLEGLLGSYGATGTSACTVSSNGRGVLDYPNHSSLISILLGLLGLPTGPPDARVVYLVSPNHGYFLETGYAGLGHLEAQTGAPFSLATLKGTYVEGTIPASSLASINASGNFTADGAGNATYTLDENVGVGTLNVLQLGTSGSTTYSLSNPNGNATPATAGRYVFADGTTVVYAISPGRFVVIDTNPLTTSPTVSLLY